MPYSGFIGRYAAAEIMDAINDARMTLVFVNTRAQAEIMFRTLWDLNRTGLPIALYHGSLDREQRARTEKLMAEGRLRAIVTTSALELGIDWGDVDLVIQVSAPKGVSRLLQRIGRANHRLDESSRALLVPGNRFEAIECVAAMDAIRDGDLDGDTPGAGALDVVAQFIVNCACSAPVTRDSLLNTVRRAFPYRDIETQTFDALLRFTQNGGYALSAYEQYARLVDDGEDRLRIASRKVANRHRQNVGTIVEAARLRVKRLRRSHQGAIIGEVEEYFAQQLSKGDTFLFNGELLEFEGVRDMIMEVRPAKSGGQPKVPAYVGGQLPLSTWLADRVRQLVSTPDHWQALPAEVVEWLTLQRAFSALPDTERLLIEHFPRGGVHDTVFYTFSGRPANQALGMLITRRMESLGAAPLGFSINDYSLSVTSLRSIEAREASRLFDPSILEAELEDWILDSPMLRRAFRRVAMVAGLTEQNHAGTRKTLRQVTFSTDLIFDVLRRYEPDHVLLRATREEAERDLLDLGRLRQLLERFQGRIRFEVLPGVSPMAVSLILNIRSEQVPGEGIDRLLDQESLQAEAEALMDEARAWTRPTPRADRLRRS